MENIIIFLTLSFSISVFAESECAKYDAYVKANLNEMRAAVKAVKGPLHEHEYLRKVSWQIEPFWIVGEKFRDPPYKITIEEGSENNCRKDMKLLKI